MKNKTFIIAEAGVNHNGSIVLARKLIDAAKKSGADAVKFQAYITDEICIKESKMTKYQKKTKFKTQYALLKKYELERKQIIDLYNYARKKKIIFLLSFFDVKSLDLNKDIKLNFIKIPSGEITNYLLIKKIAKLRKKTIISTGMSNYKEINIAINQLKKNGLSKKKISILYCISSYPTMADEIYLPQIKELKKKYQIEIGFSDHSEGIEASVGSVIYGAKIVEKHLTLNRKLDGPDHKSSADPKTFSLMVKSIRNIEKMIAKSKNKSELLNKYYVRKSIVASKKIKIGQIFKETNITLKRPQLGLTGDKIFKILGKKSKFNFNPNDPIKQ